MRLETLWRWMLLSFFSTVLVMALSSKPNAERQSASSLAERMKITIYLAGDSTVSSYSSSRSPRAGWGQVLAESFDKHVKIVNKAKPGRSSKSFIDEGRLTKILSRIDEGDYLFIQFGHNDAKKEDPSRFTDPSTTYKQYLQQYIDGARLKGAIPVLITPVERRRFDQDGKVLPTHKQYSLAMKELAKEKEVTVIDLTAKSLNLYQQLGPEKTKEIFLWLEPGEHARYPNGIIDNTHFQERGAREIARLVIEGMVEQNLNLVKYLK